VLRISNGGFVLISRPKVKNFRGIKECEIPLREFTTFIVSNNCGKTTVVEALALLLGRDRLVRTLTEHDFHGSAPRAVDRIEIVGCITGFTSNEPHQETDWFSYSRGTIKWLNPETANHTEIRGRYTALTVDSFANYLVRRWKFATLHVPPLTEFDAVCDTAGELLERTEVARWVAGTFGILVIDEAQELKPCRLRIAKALVPHLRTYVPLTSFSV
jgi:energy-coupling factor transporter ATP-binding protein EcfA2